MTENVDKPNIFAKKYLCGCGKCRMNSVSNHASTASKRCPMKTLKIFLNMRNMVLIKQASLNK